MTSFCTSSSSSSFFPARCFFRWRNKWKSLDYRKDQQFVCEFPLDVHLLRWEVVWWNTPRIWRDFGSVLPFQKRLTQIRPILPLSNQHGSQVKDQGRRHCCHNKQTKFPYWPTRDASLISGHASYFVCQSRSNLLSQLGELSLKWTESLVIPPDIKKSSRQSVRPQIHRTSWAVTLFTSA